MKFNLAPADRLKELLMAQSAPGAKGAYSPYDHTRQVQAGRDPRSAVSRMVSLHELYHSYLNDTTGYGLCLIMAGALANHDEDEFGDLLAMLMFRVLRTHESFATAAGVFGASGGWFDETLLQDYPDYQGFLATWRPFLDAAPHPVLAYQAIENISRAVMQTGLAHVVSQLPVEAWLDQAMNAVSPDHQLALLTTPGFAKVLFRVAVDETLQGGPELAALVRGELDAKTFREAFKSGELDPAMDALGHAYYKLARHRLQSSGGVCLDYNGHQVFTEILIEQAAKVIGEGFRSSYRAPGNEEDQLALIVGDFAQERLILHPTPYPALLMSASEMGDEKKAAMPIGPADASWIQLIALPANKATALYRFDTESHAYLKSLATTDVTAIRRRAVNTDGKFSHIELFALDGPESLREVSGHWGAIEAIIPVVSMTTLQDDQWRADWLKVFQAFGDLPVVMDRNPFAWMERLSREDGEKVDVSRIRMSLEGIDTPQFFEVFFWRVRGSGFLLFAPVSAPVAGALATQARRWPRTFIEGTGFLNENQTQLERCISHVIHEEYIAGFGWWE